MAEAGVAGYEVEPWFGVFGPAGIAPDVVAVLEKAFTEALAVPEVKEKLERAGFSPRGSTGQELSALAASEYERLGKVARAAKMMPE